jgi:ferredoxin-fold anticodon binding domain-containing protein
MVQSLAMHGEAGATAATLAAGKHKNLREVIEGSNNLKVTNSEITVFNDENQQVESQSMKINSNTGCKPMQVDLSQRAVSTENDMNMGLKKESGKKMVFYRLKQNKLDSLSNELDQNLIKQIKNSTSSKEHRNMITSDLHSQISGSVPCVQGLDKA